MSDLKSYVPTRKGRELLDNIRSLPLAEQVQRYCTHVRNYRHDTETILDGFHHLVLRTLTDRQEGVTDRKVDIDGQSFDTALALIKEKNHSYGFPSPIEFFAFLNEQRPSLFVQAGKFQLALKKYFPPPPKIDPKFGFPDSYSDSVLVKIKEYAAKATTAYENYLHDSKVMQNASRIKDRYDKRDPEITGADVKLAKESFKEAKQNYLIHAKTIAEGMPYVHQAHLKYPDELLVHKSYNKYLAKLLASREARYPAETYVLHLAAGEFDFEPLNVVVTEADKEMGRDLERVQAIFREELQLVTNRLEARFQKRKLMAALQTGLPKIKALKMLLDLAETDPTDVKTHILLARMLSEASKTMASTAQRVSMREKALSQCELAFNNIDDYMNMQGIENINVRDRMRVGFVKTISNIRIPLIRGK